MSLGEPAHNLDGPWMRKRQWASGRVRDNSRVGLIVCWFFTLLWNGCCWPIAASVHLSPAKHTPVEKWIVLLFPAMGLIGLALSIYLTVRYLKFGKSVLELETLPGCIGGWFAGTVQTSVALRDAENVRVSLRCVRRVTRGSGKHRRTSQTTLWEEEQVLTGRLAVNRDGGNTIPVSFRIPRGCEPTFDSPRDDIIWRVRVRAAMPGADYAADFTVPVFGAQQPAGFVPQAEALAAKVRGPRAAVVAMEDPQIDISINAAGRKRLIFPASRNRTTAILLTLFCLAAGGVAIGAAYGAAPFIFPLVFGAIAIILVYAAALYWLRHVELHVDRHAIERRWRMLGLSGSRVIPAEKIKKIKKKATVESNGTPYHTIYAHLPAGAKVSLVSNLSTTDAKHVVDEINQSLGKHHVDHPQRPEHQADDPVDGEERQADL